MIINLVGFKLVEYTGQDKVDRRGLEVYGVVVDSDDDKITGHPVFSSYFANMLPADVEVGAIYEVVFETYQFKGEWRARPKALEVIKE